MKRKEIEINFLRHEDTNTEKILVNGVNLKERMENADENFLFEIGKSIIVNIPFKGNSGKEELSIEMILDAIEKSDVNDDHAILLYILFGMESGKQGDFFKKNIIRIGTNTTGNEKDSEISIAANSIFRDFKTEDNRVFLWIIGGVMYVVKELYEELGISLDEYKN